MAATYEQVVEHLKSGGEVCLAANKTSRRSLRGGVVCSIDRESGSWRPEPLGWDVLSRAPWVYELVPSSRTVCPSSTTKTEGLTKLEAWKAMAEGHTVRGTSSSGRGLYFQYDNERGLLYVRTGKEPEANFRAWGACVGLFSIVAPAVPISDEQLAQELEDFGDSLRCGADIDTVQGKLQELAARVKARK